MKTELKRNLIQKHLEEWGELKQASIEHFYKSGKVSGSLLLALNEMLDEYASQFRPSSEAIKAAMDKAFDFLIAPYRPNTCWEDFRDRIAGELGSGWISVEERLPEIGQRIIAFRDENDGIYYDTTWNNEECKYYKLNNVTHWQPLPSPPTK